jgi:hypothetical protein
MQTEYRYTIPYTAVYLPEALSYPVKLWVNDAKVMRRIEVYGGMDAEIDREVPSLLVNSEHVYIC